MLLHKFSRRTHTKNGKKDKEFADLQIRLFCVEDMFQEEDPPELIIRNPTYSHT